MGCCQAVVTGDSETTGLAWENVKVEATQVFGVAEDARTLETVRRKISEAAPESIPEGHTKGPAKLGDTLHVHYTLRNVQKDELVHDTMAKNKPWTVKIRDAEMAYDYGFQTCSAINYGLVGVSAGETWELKAVEDEGMGKCGPFELYTFTVLSIEPRR
jgi:hypothetical protein